MAKTRRTWAPRPRSTVLLALLATVTAQLSAQLPETGTAEAGAKKWRPLFNGVDLTGWTVKIRGYELGVNHANTFRVEDGLLKVAYDGYEEFGRKFGHLFCDQEFTNYRLLAEYRFVGEQVKGGPNWAWRNSGLMIHGQSPQSMGVDQDFPASIEVQLLGGRAEGERTTANLCSPGTHVVMDGKLLKRHCFDSNSQTYRGDQWITVVVEARGDTIRHIIDGDTVLEYRSAQLDEGTAKTLLTEGQSKMLFGGSISLQSESHPVHFRRVEIMELDAPGPWLEPLVGEDCATHWETGGNWEFKDGVVTLKPREGERGWARFDDYLWLKGDYEDFEIEFDYKLEPRGNSGFYFHVGDKKSPVKDGIEVQIYESGSKPKDARLTDHDSGGVIPGIPPTKNSALPAGEWNHFHIVVEDGILLVRLNGKRCNEVALDKKPLKGRKPTGGIGFQDHALPISLRGLRIRRL